MLTRKAQVAEVLRAGGFVRRVSPARAVLLLYGADGNVIGAWNQAIAAAVKELHIVPRGGKTVSTRLRESEIERHLVACVKAAGGLAPKFKSPQRNGAPDRLVLRGLDAATAVLTDCLYNGVKLGPSTCRIIARQVLGAALQFVEVKAPGGKVAPHQRREHQRLRALGFRVEVVDSLARAEQVVAE